MTFTWFAPQLTTNPMLRTFYRWQAIAVIILLFGWLYGRFACRLDFVLDDYIETQASLSRPLGTAIVDSFTGKLTWSGYRPLSYSLRAGLAHRFGIEQLCGYHSVGLGLHLLNSLLVLQLASLLLGSVPWAFITALIFLLLPSHNEAVLYMSANANLLALCFALLALLATWQVRHKGGIGWMVLAWCSYLLGILAYEVILPLPVLLFALEGNGRPSDSATRPPARRWLFYGGLFVIALTTLGLRYWAMAGQLAQPRADYAISLAPAHLWRGYQILWGQLFFLQTSAWAHLPLFVNVREWMSPLNPRALVSMGLTAGATGWLLLIASRQPDVRVAPRLLGQRLAWALLWLLLFSAPFAALAGRNPENRYLYIPSLGFALLVATAAALVCQTNQRALRVLMRGALIGLVSFYAYVNTSDVAEWERAALHLRAFRSNLAQLLPATPGPSDRLIQVGVPGDVGTAYLFTTPESFQAAMQLHYGWPASQSDMGDLHLRAALTSDPDSAAQTYLVAYARESQQTYRIDQTLLCSPELNCLRYDMAGDNTGPAGGATYVQLFTEAQATLPGLALVFTPDDAHGYQLRSCWAFYDTSAVKVDPTTFDNTALTAACQEQAAALQEKVFSDTP